MENMEKKNLKNYTLISGVILIALVISAAFYFINNSNKKTATPEQPITVSNPEPSSPATPDSAAEASTASETTLRQSPEIGP